jgi:hypothetical protein
MSSLQVGGRSLIAWAWCVTVAMAA